MSRAQGHGGRVFGDYELLELLGRGAIGEAWAARATKGAHAGSVLCLKILGSQYKPGGGRHYRRETAVESLRREATTVRKLAHNNIARLLDCGAYKDIWFCAFELVDGANLGEILSWHRERGLPPTQVCTIAVEVAKALSCAHACDVLHRDVKPPNIMISKYGDVKLVDFGLAKFGATSASQWTEHVGTPDYWAPEQQRREPLTTRTDLYAMGLVMVDMLGGATDESTGELRLPGVPESLSAVVARCIREDTTERFADAEAVKKALLDTGLAVCGQSELGELAKQTISRRWSVAISPDAEDGSSMGSEQVGDGFGSRQATMHVPPRESAGRAVAAIPGTDSTYAAAMRDLQRIGGGGGGRARDGGSPGKVRLSVRWGSRFGGNSVRGHRVTLSTALAAVLVAAVVVMRLGSDHVFGKGDGVRPAARVLSPMVLVARRAGPESGGGSKVVVSKAEPPRGSDRPLSGVGPEVAARAGRRRVAERKRPRSATAATQARKRVRITIGLMPGGVVAVDGRKVGRAPVTTRLTTGVHKVSGKVNEIKRTRRVRISATDSYIVFDLRSGKLSRFRDDP